MAIFKKTLTKIIRHFRIKMIKKEVGKMDVPRFKDTKCIRRKLIFIGKVQRVGFRYEAMLIARSIGLTGNVCNQKDGSVLAYAQGPTDKIDYLISAMSSIPRIKVSECLSEDVPVVSGEDSFTIADF